MANAHYDTVDEAGNEKREEGREEEIRKKNKKERERKERRKRREREGRGERKSRLNLLESEDPPLDHYINTKILCINIRGYLDPLSLSRLSRLLTLH